MIAWFVVPYTYIMRGRRHIRYPAIDDYTQQIRAEEGRWAETEVLGDQCLVKVRASAETLTELSKVYERMPAANIDDSLSATSIAEREQLLAICLDAGYSQAEIDKELENDLAVKTMGDVLRFLATRRLKPRYDAETEEIVLDGPEQRCKSIESVDAEVR